MLCPDVYNFPVVRNNINIVSGDYNQKSKNKIKNVIQNHPYNEIVSIILPEHNSIPNKLIELIEDSNYYIVKNFDIKILLRKQFIEGFIKRGECTALTDNIQNEFCDSIAITPNGLLILTVCKDLYQELGLDGKVSKTSAEKDKYIIRINLLDKNLQNETKYLQRIRNCLSHKSLTNITLKFTWKPPDKNICPSSIAKFFHDNNCNVELCQTKVKIHEEFNLKFPQTIKSENDNDDDETSYDLIESIGMCMLSCNINDQDEYLSSYKSNEKFDEINQCLVMHCKGFFSQKFLYEFTDQLTSELQTNQLPWIVLHVRGFDLAPIDFFEREHNFQINGDNDYCLILYKDNKYFFYQNLSSNKLQK